jgi:hypothetical protein
VDLILAPTELADIKDTPTPTVTSQRKLPKGNTYCTLGTKVNSVIAFAPGPELLLQPDAMAVGLMTNCKPRGWATGLSAQSDIEKPKDTLASSSSKPVCRLALRVGVHSWKFPLLITA